MCLTERLQRNGWRTVLLFISFAVALEPSQVFAQKPKGGDYTTIDLLSPYHVADGNWSGTRATRVSNRSAASSDVYVVGQFDDDDSSASFPGLWTVTLAGSVSVLDLSSTMLDVRDVNSDGIAAGSTVGERPAVRFADGRVIVLPTPSDLPGLVWAISELKLPANASERHFMAVGNHQTDGVNGEESSLWIISETGSVQPRLPLIDTSGLKFFAYDVNSSGVMSGTLFIDGIGNVPATAIMVGSQLAITYLGIPNPQIDGFFDVYINELGDVTGRGWEWADSTIGQLGRAIVWPSTGGSTQLTSLNSGNSVWSSDIAAVSGKLQVVGDAFLSPAKGWYAFLYTDGKLSNLNSLNGTAGWTLRRAEGVNSSGDICGLGFVTVRRSNQTHGFLMRKK
jgi:hypothetical protein